jgi:uncharacterized protein (TIGR04222 family)
MNPFDLSGPSFLIFYLCLGMILIFAAQHHRHRAESGPAPKMELSDPYLIAYLRGGEKEALRLGVITLIDRDLLIVDGATVRRKEQEIRRDAVNPLEYELLKKFSIPAQAASVFEDEMLREACAPYRAKLEQAGLIPDASTTRERTYRCLVAAGILVAVGLSKIVIGITRGRPVAFLIILMIAAVGVTAITSFPRLTRRGELALEDVQTLYAHMRNRASGRRRGSATPGMMMLAAVFGITALAPIERAFARSIFSRHRSSGGSGCGYYSAFSCGSSVIDSGSSSCGSSGSDSGGSSGGSSGGDGGGSGCGGGGCGGCGSS